MKFHIPSSFVNKQIKIAVVGVGGTGGEVLDSLTRLDYGLKALGNPHGIHVTAFDADIVESHNIGRQRFSESDIGFHKSIALVNRINMFYGMEWDAEPTFFNPTDENVRQFDLIIGCVDKAAFRVELGKLAEKSSPKYRGEGSTLWLDMGNGQHTGQCVLGHVVKDHDEPLRLPTVFDLYPSLTDPALDNDDAPRCSLADALMGENGQDLFVNGSLATLGMNILWQLFTKGELDHHGLTMDVHTLKTNPLMIDELAWEFYGYKPNKHEENQREVA